MSTTNGSLSPFRPFTAADFESYAGVETRDPLIAERPWGDVILDGERVEVVLADQQMTCFSTGLFKRGVARLVAEHLAAMPSPTPAELVQYLDRM